MILYVLHLYQHDPVDSYEPYEIGRYLYRSFENLKAEGDKLTLKDDSRSYSWSTTGTED